MPAVQSSRGEARKGDSNRSGSLHSRRDELARRKGMSLLPVKSCSPAPLFLQHKRGLYGRESMVFWKRSSVHPRRTPATLSPQSSLAMWGKLFILRFSQVATNYTLFVFAGALCKTPRARCSEMQDAYIYNCSRWVWLAAPVRRSCVPIWLPSALPSLPGRDHHSILSALFSPLRSSPPHFL